MFVSELISLTEEVLGEKAGTVIGLHEDELSSFLQKVPVLITSITEICDCKPDVFLQSLGTTQRLRLIAKIREKLEAETQSKTLLLEKIMEIPQEDDEENANNAEIKSPIVLVEISPAVREKYQTLMLKATKVKDEIIVYALLAYYESHEFEGENVEITPKQLSGVLGNFKTRNTSVELATLRTHLRHLRDEGLGSNILKGFTFSVKKLREKVGIKT